MKNIFLIITVILAFSACTSSPEGQKTTKSTPVEEVEKTDSLQWINTQIIEDPNNTELYMAKGRYFMRQNKINLAIPEFDRAINADTLNTSFLTQKADAYYETNDLVKAKPVYEKILELEPINKNANTRMAWISLIAGKHESCFVYANNVLKENPYLAEPYYLKGLAYKEMGNFKLSVSNFRTATEQDNDYLVAWLQLGYMYDAAEDTLAGAFYENALRIDSNNVDALYAFGIHLQKWGLSEEAIAQYKHIIREDRDYHNAYYNIGYIFLEQIEQYDSAIVYYDKVLALNPYNFKAYYNRGLAFERNNNKPMARADFEKSLELKPDYDLAAKGMSRVMN